MPKVAILLLLLVFSSSLTISYAFSGDDLVISDNLVPSMNFNSDIIDVDSNFFTENDVKRYLIFGSNSQETDIIKNNSLYGITSDHGFFYVSVISPNIASGLVSQGYTVIEDSKLDFHSSEQVIPDVSRIGNITGSSIVKQQYNATGSDIVISVVDTGVDFSNPDIQHSLARDDLNRPLMLDPDGQGIILTNSTFYANISQYDTIRNYTKTLPENMIKNW